MALINCPECGERVSDQAPSCIHCGFPLAQDVPKPMSSGLLIQAQEAYIELTGSELTLRMGNRTSRHAMSELLDIRTKPVGAIGTTELTVVLMDGPTHTFHVTAQHAHEVDGLLHAFKNRPASSGSPRVTGALATPSSPRSAKDWATELEALRQHKLRVQARADEAVQKSSALMAELDPKLAQIVKLDGNIHAERQVIDTLAADGAHQDSIAIKAGHGVYVRSAKSLDAGSVTLFWDRITYSGWHGNANLPLSDIVGIDAGKSCLPARSGVPILNRYWPGKLVAGQTLLLTLGSDGIAAERMILAGLPLEDDWAGAVGTAVGNVTSLQDARRTAEEHQTAARARLETLEKERAHLQAAAELLKADLRRCERDKTEAIRELALPDWEQKTLKLSTAPGSLMHRRLEQEIQDGWEVVSTTREGQDTAVTTLRRVRRFS
jgi:hypothetical protein